MNVDCINAFISAGSVVLKQTTQKDVATGKAFIKTNGFINDTISLMIGLSGKIRGRVALNMEKEIALKIASNMMGGFVVTDFDEMTASAVGELANMIAGNASTILYNKGIGIEITPPSVVQGSIFLSDDQVICVPLTLADEGTIELNISIKE